MATKVFAGFVFFGAAAFVGGCSGGLEFNGTDNSDRINPRTTPIPAFPLPIEAYNPAEDDFQFDRATILFGRLAANPPSSGPEFAQPATAALPQNPTTFVFKTSTDIWEVTGDVNYNTPPTPANPTPPPDITEAYSVANAMTPNAAMAGMMSIVCQFMAQQVDGTPRTDTPFTYDNVQAESMPITIFNSAGIPGAASLGGFALSATLNREQRPVDQRIGVFGQLLPGQDVPTQNKNAARVPVSSPGRTNHIALGIVGGPFTFASWLEEVQQNYFIESNWSGPTQGTGVWPPVPLVNWPSTGFFNPFSFATTPGGIYLNRVTRPYFAIYDASTDISFYHCGVLLSHVVGRGIGLPTVSFIRPGVSSRQEDIMTAPLLNDVSFYQTTGRRFQYTPEAFLMMRNTSAMPIGSAARALAQSLSDSDEFDPAGARRRETLPGPKR